jgi:hypothetical protein
VRKLGYGVTMFELYVGALGSQTGQIETRGVLKRVISGALLLAVRKNLVFSKTLLVSTVGVVVVESPEVFGFVTR